MSDLSYIRWRLAKAIEELLDGSGTAEELLAAIEALIDAKANH